MAVSKLRLALNVLGRNRSTYHSGLGTRVVGTLFGYRCGHVHFGISRKSKIKSSLFNPTCNTNQCFSSKMASRLVRIALECEKKIGKKRVKLLEETVWRTYCNGKKCGFVMRHECGPKEWKVLKAVEPISMGAGVLSGNYNGNGAEFEGELMYMRVRFKKVVGSKDSKAFYMMNPDGTGGPELSVYLLRV